MSEKRKLLTASQARLEELYNEAIADYGEPENQSAFKTIVLELEVIKKSLWEAYETSNYFLKFLKLKKDLYQTWIRCDIFQQEITEYLALETELNQEERRNNETV